MKSSIAVKEAPPAEAVVEPYLGPGEVVDVEGAVVRLRLEDGAVVRGELALAMPYAPVPGDVLLVIGRGARHYVIGVLKGAGANTLHLRGDVDIRAVGGALSLSGDRGVELRGPEVAIHAGKLEAIATNVVERFTSLYQRVASLARVHAKELHTVVDETATTSAKSATILADEAVTVNGKQILLG